MDIIVFPEATLSNDGAYVPSKEESVIPCYDAKYGEVMMQLSCVAHETEKYVVVNLLEISDCTPESQLALNDTRPCSSSGLNKYNTIVVFDRNVRVVSRFVIFISFLFCLKYQLNFIVFLIDIVNLIYLVKLEKILL